MPGEKVGTTVHTFERAGLGLAPFKFVGFFENVFVACPGAPPKPGGTCDYCGTGIRDCFQIQSADGKKFVVGCDCVAKTGDAGLRKIIDGKVAEIKRERAHALDDEKIATGLAAFKEPAVEAALKLAPHPVDHWAAKGQTKWDQLDWFFRNAGRSGRVWAARMVLEFKQTMKGNEQ